MYEISCLVCRLLRPAFGLFASVKPSQTVKWFLLYLIISQVAGSSSVHGYHPGCDSPVFLGLRARPVMGESLGRMVAFVYAEVHAQRGSHSHALERAHCTQALLLHTKQALTINRCIPFSHSRSHPHTLILHRATQGAELVHRPSSLARTSWICATAALMTMKCVCPAIAGTGI